MPTLNWIGKEAVVEHHKQVPFHLLRCDPALSVGGPGSGNLLVQADNLLALKALLPYYKGQVKCIYIDPPYNTGNESWVYNDNVSGPEIQAWLGRVVGKEAEDLSRHDKWLCMMYPRLVLLRELLSENGSFWMSIDDNEVHHARAVLDEIFGFRNFIANVVWHKRVSPANDALYFSSDHDHIIIYAKDKEVWRPNRLKRSTEQLKYYKNPDNDPRGLWNSAAYTCAKTADERPNLYYPVVNPNTGKEIWPSRNRVWAYDKNTHQRNVTNNLLYWGKDGQAKMPRLKRFLKDARLVVPRSIWGHNEAGHNQEAKLEIMSMFSDTPFATPKPTRLIKRILQIATNPDDMVLDSFAGSGTTGHAVLKLNQEDSGDRRFILVEMEPEIARPITSERLKRAIEGYEWVGQRGKVNREEGLGGGFRFCELGPTLFDAQGQIRDVVSFSDLAHHIFFTETGEPLQQDATSETVLLGEVDGIAVYLLYNGVLEDKSTDGGNVLTQSMLAGLPPHDGPKVVYGNGCMLSSAYLREVGVTFRQIPYKVKVG